MYSNRVMITGFVGHDAETHTTRNDSTFTTLSVATKRSWKNRETGAYDSQTTWHKCVVFGPQAAFAATLSKGAHVQIDGELRTREYTDRPRARRSRSRKSAYSGSPNSTVPRNPNAKGPPRKRPLLSWGKANRAFDDAPQFGRQQFIRLTSLRYATAIELHGFRQSGRDLRCRTFAGFVAVQQENGFSKTASQQVSLLP